MRLFDIDVSSPNGSGGPPPRDPVTEAIRAIGAHNPETDWKLDVDAHGNISGLF
ncbi:MAG: hypothetical protein K2Y05_09855 [Hyphomicrobiaceae bacterium]|nr:hypothetical protein [Hyphomicrobiaceae bacterium]